jgi:hypothetical protein
MGVPLTTATEAVHHPCITSTAFGGLPRNRGPTRNRMVKPKPLAGAKNPAYRPATEMPYVAGFLYVVRQTRASRSCVREAQIASDRGPAHGPDH